MGTQTVDQLTGLVVKGVPPNFKPVTFKAAKGKIAVALATPEKESSGGILLPDGAVDEVFTNVGRVIAVGEGIDDVKVGDVGLVEPYVGTYLEGFAGYDVVCFLGDEGSRGVCDVVDYHDHLLAVVEGIDSDMPSLKPLGTKMLVRFEGRKEQEGVIFLPSAAQKSSNVAVVMEVGSKVTGFKPGDVVLLRSGSVTRLELADKFESYYKAKKGHLGFVDEEGVYATV
jgi:co-chaperonin GroES (HSP10)